jgi:lysozyme family protein
MASFDKAYSLVIRHEGGYVNDPDDKGGETYRGISRRYNPTWPGWQIIDRIKQTRPIKFNEIINEVNLKVLVKQLYKANYWDRIKGDQIRSQEVANIFFDFYVMTMQGAVTTMQKALVSQGKRISVDGAFGAQTLAAINAADPASLHDTFKLLRAEYHKRRVERDPSQAKFLKGWLARAWGFEDLKKKV